MLTPPPDGERDELEAVDVDEPAVRDLQMGDHREREEREGEERRRARPAERVRSLVARAALRDHVGERRVGEQTGDRERALGEDAQVVDRDDPAAELGQALDREGHVAVGHADDDEVVRVVGDARRERAALQPRAGDEAETDAAGGEVALDDRDLREVAPGARDCLASSTAGSRTSDSVTTWSSTSPIARALAAAPRDREVRRRERRRRARTGAPSRGSRRAGTSSIGRPRLSTSRRREAHEVGEDEQVGTVAGRDRAVAAQAVPERRVVRRHDDRVLGRDAERDRLAHHAVDVACVGDVLRVAVVGAERDAPRRRTPRRAGAERAGSAPSTPRGRGATSRPAGARAPPRP